MHIALVLTQSLESPSGLGRYWPIARELASLGYRVSIVAPHHNFSRDVPRYQRRDGVEVWCSGQMHVRKIGPRKEYFSPGRLIGVSLAAAWRSARLVAQLKPDILHLGKPQPINGLAARWALFFRPSMKLYVDCDDYELESNRTTGGWQRRVLRYFEDGLPRQAMGVSANTRFLADRLRGLGIEPDRIHLVPNGVDRRRFSMDSSIDRTREWPGEQTADSKRVLYAGSLSLVNHPVDLLLAAFERVHCAEPSASLLVAGGGDDFDTLQAQVARRGQAGYVRLAGVVPAGDVPAYYRAAHLTVDPVYGDRVAQARSPLKVVESLAAGTPVVTADVGDRRWMLGDGQAGLLVEPGSPRALADGILALFRNEPLRRNMAECALKMREQFWWDVLVKSWVRMYPADARS